MQQDRIKSLKIQQRKYFPEIPNFEFSNTLHRYIIIPKNSTTNIFEKNLNLEIKTGTNSSITI